MDHNWLGGFTNYERYDTLWYLQIGSLGYDSDDGSAAFFPLYPLLIRGVGFFTGDHWLLAATLVSNASLLVALILLYRLTTLELSETIARRTVVLLLVNPVAFFLYAPYSESLFLAISVGFFLMLRRGRWWSAASLAALASVTRSVGVVLCIALALAAIRTMPRPWRVLHRGHTTHVAAWVPRLLVGTSGFLAYLLFWEWKATATRPFDVQGIFWHRERHLPWEPLARALWDTIQNPWSTNAFIGNIGTFVALVAFGLAVYSVRRLPSQYTAFTLICLVIPLFLVIPHAPMASVPRYYLVVFPLIWTLAVLLHRRAIYTVVVAASALLLCMNAMLFVSWHEVL